MQKLLVVEKQIIMKRKDIFISEGKNRKKGVRWKSQL
jgi:hypothetical protein